VVVIILVAGVTLLTLAGERPAGELVTDATMPARTILRQIEERVA
jgi:hypothetical protein